MSGLGLEMTHASTDLIKDHIYLLLTKFGVSCSLSSVYYHDCHFTNVCIEMFQAAVRIVKRNFLPGVTISLYNHFTPVEYSIQYTILHYTSANFKSIA